MPLNISTVWKVWYFVTAAAIFAIVTYLWNSDKGWLASMAFGVLALAVRLKWALRSRLWLWMIIALWVIIHVIAIFGIRWRITVHPTIILAPLVFIDYFLVVGSIGLIENVSKRDA
jgi:hypothetical protein